MVYDPDGSLNFLFAPEVDGMWTSTVSAVDTTHLSAHKQILLTQGEHSNGDGGTSFFDVVFVRKHVGIEPLWASPGNEEPFVDGVSRWNVILNFTGSGGQHDNLVFGEASDASDGQDSYDVPKPTIPPPPCVYAWFATNLSEPYDTLWKDYRRYPDTSKVWDLDVLWENASAKNITISWNSSRLNSSEYKVITLRDVDGNVNTSMILKNSYRYLASPHTVHRFQIICTITPPIYMYKIPIKAEWNLISFPVNQSIPKNNITICYLGVNYSWQEAVNISIILNSLYGWNTAVQNYLLSETGSPGGGYWVYGYHDCDLWISSSARVNTPFITNLLINWNLVGLPYDLAQVKSNLTIFYNGTDYSWSEAVNNSIVLGSIYGWDGVIQNYALTDVLSPGQGYWMYAYHNCVLKRKVN